MTKTVKDAFDHGKAFIPFITAGDPDLATTKELVFAMEEAGADLIELGIPFSDPTAEGPVIQAANERALKNGVTTDRIFDMVDELREKTDIPLVFMTYANVVFSYGTERFAERMAKCGMQGLILPDVPYEEKEEFDGICKKHGIDFISLVAPTSQERITEIAGAASGFLYCVSSLGVTGTRSSITTDVGSMVALAKKANPSLPTAIGFGISNAETAHAMGEKADGVIVGSAIVKIIAEHGSGAVPYVKEFVKTLKEAL